MQLEVGHETELNTNLAMRNSHPPPPSVLLPLRGFLFRLRSESIGTRNECQGSFVP